MQRIRDFRDTVLEHDNTNIRCSACLETFAGSHIRKAHQKDAKDCSVCSQPVWRSCGKLHAARFHPNTVALSKNELWCTYSCGYRALSQNLSSHNAKDHWHCALCPGVMFIGDENIVRSRFGAHARESHGKASGLDPVKLRRHEYQAPGVPPGSELRMPEIEQAAATAPIGSGEVDGDEWVQQSRARLQQNARYYTEAQTQFQLSLNEAAAGSRMHSEAQIYQDVMFGATLGTMLKAETYQRMVNNAEGFEADQFIFCTWSEARFLLDRYGILKIPILIPKAWNSDEQLDTIQELFAELVSETVDVHIGDSPHAAESGAAPAQLPSEEVWHGFRAGNILPGYNLLNLRNESDTPIVRAVSNIKDLRFLQYWLGVIRGQYNARLNTVKKSLPSWSWTFKVCGQRGVFSMPHVDRHGVMTAILVHEGVKIWFYLGDTHESDLQKYRYGKPFPRDSSWIAMCLEEGDTFIQCPSTFHAPYSLTNVLCAGSMHLHPEFLHLSIKATEIALQNHEVSNEDAAIEYIPLLLRYFDKKTTENLDSSNPLPDKSKHYIMELLPEVQRLVQRWYGCCQKRQNGGSGKHGKNCPVWRTWESTQRRLAANIAVDGDLLQK